MSGFRFRAIRASLTIASLTIVSLTIACVAAVTAIGGMSAKAGDVPARIPAAVVAPAPPFDWNGLYFGGHMGYGQGRVSSTVFDPGAASSDNSFGSLFLGLQAGYNVVLPSRMFVGVEADLSFANFYADSRITTRVAGVGGVTDDIDYIGRVRGRLGYAFDRWLIYGTGGFAWSQARVFAGTAAEPDQAKVLTTRTGWVVGGGAELAIAPQWSARLEYLYDEFGGISADFPPSTRYESSFKLHTVRLGLNRKFGPGGEAALPEKKNDPWPISSDNWNVHGQATFIGQGYPSFRSPYEGQNSLAGHRQFQNTTSATAFLGLRLSDSTEFYLNPELMQGNGLSNTFGLGGYSNGEAQKSGFPIPRANIARAFLKHTIGLGGAQETVEDGPNQLAGKQDISRITLVAGKVSVIDYFDGNTYSHDPRKDFLN